MLVKENIVNILKAVGARGRNADGKIARTELSQAELGQMVDLTQPLALRALVDNAITKQLDDDSKSLHKTFGKRIAYTFNNTKRLLTDSTGLTPAQCDALLTDIGLDIDGATDIVLQGVVAGLPEQRGMDAKVAEQSATVLTAMFAGDYPEYLRNNHLTEAQLPLAQYKKLRQEALLVKRLATLVGSEAQADQILKQKVDPKHPYLQNEALREQYLAVKAQRDENDPEMRVIDLFTNLSTAVAQAQVVAFYESRTHEQNQIAADGARLSDNSPTKIGNVLGKEGRAATEAVVGARLHTVAAASHAANKSKLPEHKWRGYAKLGKLLTNTIRYMYATIQTTGFVERLVGKYKTVGMAAPNPNLHWDAQYEAMPAAYADNQAGAFFDKTQARLTADRVRALDYATKLQNAAAQAGYGVEDVVAFLDTKKALAAERKKNKIAEPYPEEIPSPQMARLVDLYQTMTYYETRVKVATHALTDLPKIVAENPQVVNDEASLAHLDSNIVHLRDGALPGEAPEIYQKRVAGYQELATLPNAAIQDALVQGEKTAAADNLIYALQTFLNYNHAPKATENTVAPNPQAVPAPAFQVDPAGQAVVGKPNPATLPALVTNPAGMPPLGAANLAYNTSFVMLADLFGIRDKFAAGTVTQAELEDLINNVQTQNGTFNPDVINKMINDLRSGALQPDKCRQVLHESAVNFLKGKYQETYTNYEMSQAAATEIQNM